MVSSHQPAEESGNAIEQKSDWNSDEPVRKNSSAMSHGISTTAYSRHFSIILKVGERGMLTQNLKTRTAIS
jgi:hypothetical protein